MSQQMNPFRLQDSPDRLGLGDIASYCPEICIQRTVESTGAKQVEGDNSVAVVDEARVGFPEIIARQTRSAIQAKNSIRTTTF